MVSPWGIRRRPRATSATRVQLGPSEILRRSSQQASQEASTWTCRDTRWHSSTRAIREGRVAVRLVASRSADSRPGEGEKSRGDKGATRCGHGPGRLRDRGDHAACRLPPSPRRSERRALGRNWLWRSRRRCHACSVRHQPEREREPARRGLILRRPRHGLVPRRDGRTVRDPQRDHVRCRSVRRAGERERRPVAGGALAPDLRPAALWPGARPGSRRRFTARRLRPIPLRQPRHFDRLRRQLDHRRSVSRLERRVGALHCGARLSFRTSFLTHQRMRPCVHFLVRSRLSF